MSKEFDVCIVGGGGHIGLPLGLALAKEGKKVIAYDINKKTVDTIAQAKMPFLEDGAQEVLDKTLNKSFWVTTDKEVIKKSKFIIVVIGTPVDEHLNPQFTLFKEFFEVLLPYLDNDQHIVLRSTVYPGSTQRIKDLLLNNGKKTKISFCPERIVQGKAMEELYTLPQIVSSCTPEALTEVSELFLLLTPKVFSVSFLEAELAKLFINSWRYMQFAVANQFYQIAEQNGVDFYNIYDAVTRDYSRSKGFAKAGFSAGPCLFKDTMQLASFGDNAFFLGHSAMLVNEGMPNFIVKQLKQKHDLKTKTVGVLGMAFKANNDDKRESLSYKLKKILEMESYRVICSDVYIQDEKFFSSQQLIDQSDIIILGTPHKEY
ncbi:MAG: UDP-N-acetyl-D-mannosaminuronic acid dehydrogenase, partial [Alteromonas naphthalenivorans]